MFYDLFCELCAEKKISPTRASIEIGLSKSTATKWKNTGATPQGDTLNKIAEYFGVSVDYLLGKTKNPYGGFGVLDPVLPANMRGVNLDGAKLDEYQLRAIINNLSFLDKRSPIYERTKKAILSIARSSELSDFSLNLISKLENEQKERPAQSNVQVRDEHDNIVVLDDETRDIIDGLRSNPEMKMLFSVSKNATKEDIIKTVKIIEALKDKEEGDR